MTISFKRSRDAHAIQKRLSTNEPAMTWRYSFYQISHLNGFVIYFLLIWGYFRNITSHKQTAHVTFRLNKTFSNYSNNTKSLNGLVVNCSLSCPFSNFHSSPMNWPVTQKSPQGNEGRALKGRDDGRTVDKTKLGQYLIPPPGKFCWPSPINCSVIAKLFTRTCMNGTHRTNRTYVSEVELEHFYFPFEISCLYVGHSGWNGKLRSCLLWALINIMLISNDKKWPALEISTLTIK